MGITQVIRGDDHFSNTFRQLTIYDAMGWTAPSFAHIPLIHGSDGAKLSKRHGALGAHEYEGMGILPEAMCNYLLRLGWSHGDEEIIPQAKAIEWFNVESIGRSPARFDMNKLLHLNAHYIKEGSPDRLFDLIQKQLEELSGQVTSPELRQRIISGMPGLAERSKTLLELADNAVVYWAVQPLDEKAQTFVTAENKGYIAELITLYQNQTDFTHDTLMETTKGFCETKGIKLGGIAQALRVALTGRTISPSIFDMMQVFGQEESMTRLRNFDSK
jgi:glutamyl-tRNA synthetase